MPDNFEMTDEMRNKTKPFSMRMSNGLHEYIQENSELQNKTKSEFVREMIIYGEVKNEPDKQDLKLLRLSVQRVGNNINQIAHALNVAKKEGSLSEIDYEELLEYMVKINKSVVDLWV